MSGVRLARVGRAGGEKPVAVYDDDDVRDISIFVSDIDRALIGGDWRGSIAGVERTRMPAVDPAARRGACVEHQGRMIQAARGPGGALAVSLRSGRTAGPHDPIRPAAFGDLVCEAGVAAIVRGNDARVEISAVCLVLAIAPGVGPDRDSAAAAVMASAAGLLSLGPYCVAFEDWRDAAVGSPQWAFDRSVIDNFALPTPHDLRGLVAAVDRMASLDVGDIVFASARGGPRPWPTGCASVSISAGRLGSQQRNLEINRAIYDRARVCEPMS